MDKLYYLLQCHQLLLGHPQMPALRAKVAGMLADLEADAKAASEPVQPKAPTADVPKVVPTSTADAPVIERKI